MSIRRRNKIKSILGWCMLFVFAIAVTPKLYFHNAFTHHKDQLFVHSGQKAICQYEYSCGFVNIETTSPFVDPGERLPFLKPADTAIVPDQKPVALYNLYPAPAYLRGPPAYIS